MTKNELNKIKRIIKNIDGPDHTFSILGEYFSCIWNGTNFIWKAPSGEKYKMNQNEVISSIGDGMYIKEYAYSCTINKKIV